MIEMGTALLIDIGSTFTKASLVDLARQNYLPELNILLQLLQE